MQIFEIIINYAKDIYSRRELLYNLIVKDLKSRYKTTTLGFLWAILNPLLMMTVLSIVFSLFIKLQIEKFPVFLLTGLLPWYFLSLSLSVSTISIVDNANLIKKVSFTRVIIPLSVVISNLINFLLSLIVLFIFMLIFKINFSFLNLFLPFVILIQFTFVAGISFISAVLHTFYRDVKYIVEALLLCGFYATPIFYSLSMVPQRLQKIYMLNPMVGIVTAYRDLLLYNNIPHPEDIAYIVLFSLTVFVIGLIIFRKYEKVFADYV